MMILDSARKHGYTDEDIHHAIRNRIATHDMDGYVMIVGPTYDGDLIETGVNRRDEVFHAMRARRQFLPPRKR